MIDRRSQYDTTWLKSRTLNFDDDDVDYVIEAFWRLSFIKFKSAEHPSTSETSDVGLEVVDEI